MSKRKSIEGLSQNVVRSQIGEVYRVFRRHLMSASALEEQFEQDASFLDESGVQEPSSFEVTYAREAAESLVEAFDRAVAALDLFERTVPDEILDDLKLLQRTVSRTVGKESEALKAAFTLLAKNQTARRWLENLRRDLQARRTAFQLGSQFIAAEGVSLRDVFMVRNALVNDSPASPLDKLANPSNQPEPQPFIILCAFGPPGARIVCIVGLAIAIGASNHNVE